MRPLTEDEQESIREQADRCLACAFLLRDLAAGGASLLQTACPICGNGIRVELDPDGADVDVWCDTPGCLRMTEMQETDQSSGEPESE